MAELAEQVKRILSCAWHSGKEYSQAFDFEECCTREGWDEALVRLFESECQRREGGGATSRLLPRGRPGVCYGDTPRFRTACGWVYITVNADGSGYPFETFARMGKMGGCSSAMLESLGRVASAALRCGVDAEVLVKQLHGIKCPGGAWDEGERIDSCAAAFGLAIQWMLGRYRQQEGKAK